MHLAGLNLPELITKLWHGTLREDRTSLVECEHAFLIGQAWKEHGALVASTWQYLPTSFGQAPRDPALKIKSGYKAWKFIIYIWAIGPAVFCPYIPHDNWRHFCKLVHGIHVVMQ